MTDNSFTITSIVYGSSEKDTEAQKQEKAYKQEEFFLRSLMMQIKNEAAEKRSAITRKEREQIGELKIKERELKHNRLKRILNSIGMKVAVDEENVTIDYAGESFVIGEEGFSNFGEDHK